jgi:hypothetical protein
MGSVLAVVGAPGLAGACDAHGRRSVTSKPSRRSARMASPRSSCSSSGVTQPIAACKRTPLYSMRTRSSSAPENETRASLTASTGKRQTTTGRGSSVRSECHGRYRRQTSKFARTQERFPQLRTHCTSSPTAVRRNRKPAGVKRQYPPGWLWMRIRKRHVNEHQTARRHIRWRFPAARTDRLRARGPAHRSRSHTFPRDRSRAQVKVGVCLVRKTSATDILRAARH